MKLPLAYFGDPILRKKCKSVDTIDDALRQLIQDMEETLIAHDGLGIAAPQIHRDLALFLTRTPIVVGPDQLELGPTRVFINPKIIEHSDEEWWRGEGCLSIPGIYGEVSRPMHIKVEATDSDGNRFTQEFSELEARAILHENDHINGVLFIDRIRGKERQEIEHHLRALKKQMATRSTRQGKK